MESLDRLFDVFRRERRRYALYALDDADGPMSIEELAEQVRQWEDDGNGPSADEFEEVVLSLAHTHLPKASQAEYIEYDRERDEIRISGEPTEFQVILTVSEAFENHDTDELFDPDSLTPEEFLGQFTTATQSSD